MLLWFNLGAHPTGLPLVEALGGPVLCTVILASLGDPVSWPQSPSYTPVLNRKKLNKPNRYESIHSQYHSCLGGISDQILAEGSSLPLR